MFDRPKFFHLRAGIVIKSIHLVRDSMVADLEEESAVTISLRQCAMILIIDNFKKCRGFNQEFFFLKKRHNHDNPNAQRIKDNTYI